MGVDKFGQNKEDECHFGTHFLFCVDSLSPSGWLRPKFNNEVGEDLAVCAITIEKMDALLFSKPGQDQSGRLDTSLFEIDSHKFIISDSRIIKNFQDVAIGEVMNQMENVDYIVDVHVH